MIYCTPSKKNKVKSKNRKEPTKNKMNPNSTLNGHHSNVPNIFSKGKRTFSILCAIYYWYSCWLYSCCGANVQAINENLMNLKNLSLHRQVWLNKTEPVQYTHQIPLYNGKRTTVASDLQSTVIKYENTIFREDVGIYPNITNYENHKMYLSKHRNADTFHFNTDKFISKLNEVQSLESNNNETEMLTSTTDNFNLDAENGSVFTNNSYEIFFENETELNSSSVLNIINTNKNNNKSNINNNKNETSADKIYKKKKSDHIRKLLENKSNRSRVNNVFELSSKMMFNSTINNNFRNARVGKVSLLGLFELSSQNKERPEGRSELAAAMLAVKHINERMLLPGYTLELLTNDTKVSFCIIIFKINRKKFNIKSFIQKYPPYSLRVIIDFFN